MQITFLGTGTSQGVPIIACPCNVCASKDSRDKRLRTSVLIETNNKIFVIDTGPDFRQQMLRENVKQMDAIIFTHEHKDHTAGFDDIRAFNFVNKKKIQEGSWNHFWIWQDLWSRTPWTKMPFRFLSRSET